MRSFSSHCNNLVFLVEEQDEVEALALAGRDFVPHVPGVHDAPTDLVLYLHHVLE